MTIEEAKKILEGELLAVTLESNVSKETQQKRLNEKFRALNVAIEAIDKQIPRKPIGGFDFANNEYKICCECSAIVQDGEWKANYCPDCGQVLDWSDNSDE